MIDPRASRLAREAIGWSPAFLAAIAFCLVAIVAPLAAQVDAWQELDKARFALRERGPTTLSFEQTLIPAGFTDGDTEQGELDLDLPGCLRWDYRDPYPRSFLICGSVGYHWNEGEAVGRRFFVAQDEPGLDLLLQDREHLARRYVAERREDGAIVEIVLTPRNPEAGASEDSLAEARIRLQATSSALQSLAYEDRAGNHNRFVFGEARPLADRGVFEPPAGVAWAED